MEAMLDAATVAVLRAVGDALPGGSVNVFDRYLRYVYAAGPGLTNVGLAAGALVGRTIADVFGAEGAALVESHYQRAFAGERVTFDLPVFDRVFNVTAAPFMPLPEATILVLAHDVTAMRVTSGEHLRREVVVATIAHELRQPIGPLRTALELLKTDELPQSQARLTGIMERQVQVLERLVADLSSVGDDGGGNQPLKLRRVELKEVLADAVEAIRHMVQDRQQAVVLVGDETLPVYGDEVRLRQVFSNLLSNAAKYTPAEGRIDIRGFCDGQHVRITISDTGRGIRSELLPRVFDMFVKGEETSGGMGIGLNVVRRLVEAHRGRIDARSEGTGRGSSFTVTFPRADD